MLTEIARVVSDSQVVLLPLREKLRRYLIELDDVRALGLQIPTRDCESSNTSSYPAE
jgi:hypothetical protein